MNFPEVAHHSETDVGFLKCRAVVCTVSRHGHYFPVVGYFAVNNSLDQGVLVGG
jgi:hypothetical protein